MLVSSSTCLLSTCEARCAERCKKSSAVSMSKLPHTWHVVPPRRVEWCEESLTAPQSGHRCAPRTADCVVVFDLAPTACSSACRGLNANARVLASDDGMSSRAHI